MHIVYFIIHYVRCQDNCCFALIKINNINITQKRDVDKSTIVIIHQTAALVKSIANICYVYFKGRIVRGVLAEKHGHFVSYTSSAAFRVSFEFCIANSMLSHSDNSPHQGEASMVRCFKGDARFQDANGAFANIPSVFYIPFPKGFEEFQGELF